MFLVVKVGPMSICDAVTVNNESERILSDYLSFAVSAEFSRSTPQVFHITDAYLNPCSHLGTARVSTRT